MDQKKIEIIFSEDIEMMLSVNILLQFTEWLLKHLAVEKYFHLKLYCMVPCGHRSLHADAIDPKSLDTIYV